VGELVKKSIYRTLNNFAYISPLCREASLGQIYMKFCMRGHLVDVINRAKFYLNRVRGFDSVGSRIFDFPRGKKSPLSRH